MRKYFLPFYLENNVIPMQHSSIPRYDAMSIGSFVPIDVVSRPTRLESRSVML